MTSYCREIAEEYQLPMPKMNSKYCAYASKSFDLALMAGVIAIVLIGGYIVIPVSYTHLDVYKRQLEHNVAANQNNGNHASHQCKIKGFRDISKIFAVHFGHRKLIFLCNLPAIRGHQFFAQLVAVFEMDIGAIASRVKPCLLYTSGSGKAAGYIIAPSHVSFSVLPVAAPSGAVRYLRRSAPAVAV